MMPRRFIERLAGAVLLLAAVSTVGCATTRKSSLERGQDDLVQAKSAGDFDQTVAAADEAWSQRHVRPKLETALDGYEKAVEMETPGLDPSERKKTIADLWVRLSHGYFILANEHIAESDLADDEREATMIDVFDRGVTAAENALVLLDPDLARAVSGGESLADMVEKSAPAAIPGLFWYAMNLSKWGVMQGTGTIMQHQSNIFATMQHICEAEPSYFYGGCHRYFGAYWTRIPFGKSAEKSKKHFDAALEIAPNFLTTKVVKAQYYAKLIDDGKLRKTLLREVAEASVDELPEAMRPENTFARDEARRILDKETK